MRGMDYGSEVRIYSRCLDMDKRRLGVVMVLRDAAHWNCREDEAQWRPRSAYVLWDDTTPMRGGFHPSAPYDDLSLHYLAPESMAIVPPDWLVPSGVNRAELTPLLAPSVGVLRREPHGPHKGWWLMNRRDRGWGEHGRRLRHLGELRAQYGCALVVGEGDRIASRQDEHGIYWPIVEVTRW